MLFTGVWSIIKGWLDEKTRAKIAILGGGYVKKLKESVDENQLPDFLGGKNTAKLADNWGPWNNYEVVDGSQPGATVGVRKKGEEKVFTMYDFELLDNPMIPFKISESPEMQEALKNLHEQDKKWALSLPGSEGAEE